jgi:hypothetical protein
MNFREQHSAFGFSPPLRRQVSPTFEECVIFSVAQADMKLY